MSSNLFCFIKKILIGFMAEEYEDIKRLFRISSQTFDDHTKRISALLENAQEKFEHDYTSYAAVGGGVLIVFLMY